MKRSRCTSHNVINSKRLEIPIFPTIRHGKYTFGYEAVKLWNMLENKYKEMMDFKSFKESFYLWHAQCVRILIVYNVLYMSIVILCIPRYSMSPHLHYSLR